VAKAKKISRSLCSLSRPTADDVRRKRGEARGVQGKRVKAGYVVKYSGRDEEASPVPLTMVLNQHPKGFI